MKISVKRIYEKPHPDDGLRILVDRLWPRGLSKEAAGVDVWLKAIAPSNDLRNWYHHDPQKWAEFKKRYFAEIEANRDAVDELAGYVRKGKVTFLYSSKESEKNNAIALNEYVDIVLDNVYTRLY